MNNYRALRFLKPFQNPQALSVDCHEVFSATNLSFYKSKLCSHFSSSKKSVDLLRGRSQTILTRQINDTGNVINAYFFFKQYKYLFTNFNQGLANLAKTCSCRPVCTLFWDDITKFWDENLLLCIYFLKWKTASDQEEVCLPKYLNKFLSQNNVRKYRPNDMKRFLV